jgi:hypothetical protein
VEWRTKGALHYRAPFSSIKDFRLPHKRAHLDACTKTAEVVAFYPGRKFNLLARAVTILRTNKSYVTKYLHR